MPLGRSEMSTAAKTAMIPALLGLLASACAGMGGPANVRHEPLSAVAPSDLAEQVAARIVVSSRIGNFPTVIQ